jgi:hypothetical protein
MAPPTAMEREERNEERKKEGSTEPLFTEGHQPRWRPTVTQGRQRGWRPPIHCGAAPGAIVTIGHQLWWCPTVQLRRQPPSYPTIGSRYGKSFFDDLFVKKVSLKGQNKKLHHFCSRPQTPSPLKQSLESHPLRCFPPPPTHHLSTAASRNRGWE